VGNRHTSKIEQGQTSAAPLKTPSVAAGPSRPAAVVTTIMRGLRGLVTPATILARMDRLWSRNTMGGAVKVVHTARREIRIEAHGTPYLDFRYNRIALMGYYQQALAPSASTLTMRELPKPGPAAAAWSVGWS